MALNRRAGLIKDFLKHLSARRKAKYVGCIRNISGVGFSQMVYGFHLPAVDIRLARGLERGDTQKICTTAKRSQETRRLLKCARFCAVVGSRISKEARQSESRSLSSAAPSKL